MEQSWRFRPMQGSICPFCSISHIPFCCQSLAFDRNGFGGDDFRRLRMANDHPFHRPFLDPLFDNQMVQPMHRPLSHFDNSPNSMELVEGSPGDGYGSSQSLYKIHNLERHSFREFPVPSQLTDSARGVGFEDMRFDHRANRFMSGEFLENDRTHKRMKVDGMGNGSSTQIPTPYHNDYYSNPARLSTEEERRLNMIRDHGLSPNVSLSQAGFDSSFGTGFDVVSRPSGYLRESSLHDRNRHGIVGGHANFDLHYTLPNNVGTNSSHDPGFISDDRKGSIMHPDRAYDLPGYFMRDKNEKNEFWSDVHGSGIGPPHFRSNVNGLISEMENEQQLQSHSGQMENSANHLLQNYGLSNVPDVAPNCYDLARQSQEPSSLHREEVYRHSSHHTPYPFPLGSKEKYRAHDLHQLQSKDFMPAKGPLYHRTNCQISSSANMSHHELGSSFPMGSAQLPHPNESEHQVGSTHDRHFYDQKVDVRQSIEVKPLLPADVQVPDGPQNFSASTMKNYGNYLVMSAENSMLVQDSQTFRRQPPLPPLPPLPPPADPPGPPAAHRQPTTSPSVTSLLYPIPSSSSTSMPLAHQPAHDMQPVAQAYFNNKQHLPASTGFVTEGSQIILQTSSKQYSEDEKPFPLKYPSPDRAKVIDASHLFRQPHRTTRPDHFVIILRGLPGSGKSYLAKMLRDLEVENGGDAPRIHSMDDYFMTEVEKVEESESSKSSCLAKGKKRITKKVMEYCYEPEMEEAYRSSMLKAFKKTLEEGIFTFIIVDDRNLRVADFAQFWATAKRSGYEVFLLEAPYKDPVGCTARNVHGFTSDGIQKMADHWEEAPPLYLRLDIQSLFHGDNLNKCGIREVLQWMKIDGMPKLMIWVK
ncbi:uncharacterized protein LOC122086460 isoform X2 [Macadamia integrifolia]|uniref:uncharacterized protein LOC122086460 isoform X2 n=1 Tax=Macadamia integrifolia TaxID=60698 RepID=UPI001C4FD505|nr:uncharacterized protein LOC122086460 isoform X2 [Macadamia integrifolia]